MMSTTSSAHPSQQPLVAMIGSSSPSQGKDTDGDDGMELESAYSSASSDSQYSAPSTSSPSSSPMDDWDSPEPPKATKQLLIIIDGQLSTNSETPRDQSKRKQYPCHWTGCQKSYVKPIRLEEHLRSHTNERPFSCTQCPATYRRETHLTAHTRMHLPESSRPLLCGWEDANRSSADPNTICQRRFWTQQHLKIHRENVHEGKKGQAKLTCHICAKEFLKHRSLRSHFVQAHCPQDIPKPYFCPVVDCGLSFSHPSRLRKHERTHDPLRYTCIHQDCSSNPEISLQQRSFSSWTDLQRHTRDAHPFNCPEPTCQRHKKPFKSIRSLKQHMQSYHPPEGQPEAEQEDASVGIATSTFVGTSRNTGPFVCTKYPPCQHAYKSARALQRHINLKHLTHRHTSCPYEGCAFSSAFPSGLARHVKSKHSDHAQTGHPVDEHTCNPHPHPTSNQPAHKRRKLTRVEKLTQIDVLTGIGYSNNQVGDQDKTSMITTSNSTRKYACPFYDLRPHLVTDPPQELLTDRPGPPHHITQNDHANHTCHDRCLLRFNRLYDIQRHLHSAHSLSVDRQILKDFYGVF